VYKGNLEAKKVGEERKGVEKKLKPKDAINPGYERQRNRKPKETLERCRNFKIRPLQSHGI